MSRPLRAASVLSAVLLLSLGCSSPEPAEPEAIPKPSARQEPVVAEPDAPPLGSPRPKLAPDEVLEEED